MINSNSDTPSVKNRGKNWGEEVKNPHKGPKVPEKFKGESSFPPKNFFHSATPTGTRSAETGGKVKWPENSHICQRK